MSRNIQSIFNGITLAPHQRPFSFTALGGESFVNLPFTPVSGLVTIDGSVKEPDVDYEIAGRRLTFLKDALVTDQVVYALFDVSLSPEHTVGRGYKPFQVTAVGGETNLVLPTPAYAVKELYVNGIFRVPNTDWTFDDKTNSITLKTALTAGQVLYAISETYRDYKDDRYRTLSEVARVVNRAESTVIFSDDLVTSIDAKKAVFDASTRKIWLIPTIGTTGNSIVSFTPEGLLTYTNGSVLCVSWNPAQAGSNSDITTLLSLVGALRLGADPVLASDAATKRYVDNAVGAGTVGPTMNGIMNYGVGKPLMHATRAYIPAYELPLDGQLVNRADYPDLWAWAQMTTPIADSAWMADVTQRGKYTTGDGSTTFRLPDWNGVQSGSIPGAFFRGGVSSADMTMAKGAVPNVKGTISVNSQYSFLLSGAVYTGPFGIGSTNMSGFNGINGGTDARAMTFDLSKVSDVYKDGVSEVTPNKVSGVWVVRAKGAFTAANTSWSVINGDATAPASGTSIKGGQVSSAYNINGVAHIKAHMQVQGKYLTDGWMNLSLENMDTSTTVANAELHPGSTFMLRYDTPQSNGVYIGGVFRSLSTGRGVGNMYCQTEANGYATLYFTLGKDGNTSFASRVMQFNEANDLVLYQNPTVTGATRAGAYSSRAGDRYMNILAYDTPGVDGGAVIETGNAGTGMGFYFFATASDANKSGKILSSTRGLVMFEGSDITWKENIVDAPSGALERIMQVKPREYDWIESGEHERGWIAQEMGEIDPQWVSGDDKLSVNTKSVIVDLIATVQTLKGMVDDLQAEVNELKSK